MIRLIGPTLRAEWSSEGDWFDGRMIVPAVYVFWHRTVVPCAWLFRGRKIAVMTSSSFDGEYIARIIEKLGFRAVRGSSTRGGAAALLGMHKEIEQGRMVAFTIDGPRGPVYVAKPGPVLLARNMQVPIVAFHVAPREAWVLKSWDRFLIPKPFSRAYVRIAEVMRVPPEDLDVDQHHERMQAALDRVRQYAEEQAHVPDELRVPGV